MLDSIPGTDTAPLLELLEKLQLPDDEEVPGLTMPEAVEVSYPVIYHVILYWCYITVACTLLYNMGYNMIYNTVV